MSKNDKKQNYTLSPKQAKAVPVDGDLSVSTECVKKSAGSSKEV